MGAAIRIAAWLVAAAVLAAAPAAGAGPAADGEKPQRIVSLYLCADLFLLQMVERDRILSLSHLVRDRATSLFADDYDDIPVNYGTAEEAVALDPDLVLAGPFAFRSRIDLIERMGIRVESVRQPDTLDGIRDETMRIARLLGEEAKGRALVARMDRTLDEARAVPGPAPEAAVYISGVAIGRGTLFAEMMDAAGIDNLADRLGMDGYGYLSMERLVHARPDMLVVGSVALDEPSLAERRLRHPALRHAFAGERTVVVPERLWTCANPSVARAVALLAQARHDLEGGR